MDRLMRGAPDASPTCAYRAQAARSDPPLMASAADHDWLRNAECGPSQLVGAGREESIERRRRGRAARPGYAPVRPTDPSV